jgi:hypothetical protein
VASANGTLAEYDIDAVVDRDRDPLASRVAVGLPSGPGRPAVTVSDVGPIVAQGAPVTVPLAHDVAKATQILPD